MILLLLGIVILQPSYSGLESLVHKQYVSEQVFG